MIEVESVELAAINSVYFAKSPWPLNELRSRLQLTPICIEKSASPMSYASRSMRS